MLTPFGPAPGGAAAQGPFGGATESDSLQTLVIIAAVWINTNVLFHF